jgi:hypothetical protein
MHSPTLVACRNVSPPNNSTSLCSQRENPIHHVGMSGYAVKVPGPIVRDHLFCFREPLIRRSPFY